MGGLKVGRSASWRSRATLRCLAERWRSLPRPLRRVTAAAVGGLLLAAGLVMLVVPGPGLLTLALGVAVLATEFA